MGHEAAGVVVQVGEVSVDVAAGDRVVIEPFFFCKRYVLCGNTVAARREETVTHHGMPVSFPISSSITHHGGPVSQFGP